MKLLLCLPLLCASCSTIKWNGFYAGVQNVSRFDKRPDRDSAGVYGNAIWNVGDKWSFQVEPIIPLNGEPPLLRIAFDRKLF